MKSKKTNNHRVGKKYKQDKTACSHELFKGKDGRLHCAKCFSTYSDGE